MQTALAAELEFLFKTTLDWIGMEKTVKHNKKKRQAEGKRERETEREKDEVLGLQVIRGYLNSSTLYRKAICQ